MRTMAAGEFKAKCLAVMDEVKATGETVLITKRGKEVARLTPPGEPAPAEAPEAIFGCLRHMLKPGAEIGDLIEPIIPLEDWDHLKEDWSLFPPE
jgi:prevent-host-death family protein